MTSSNNVSNETSSSSLAGPNSDAQYQLIERFAALRKKRGKSLCVLSSPFIPSALKKYADFVGSSYELVTHAKELQNASSKIKTVAVFGPRFIAESIDALLNAPQARKDASAHKIDVYTFSKPSDCPLVQSASVKELKECWKTMDSQFDADSQVFPVVCLSSSPEVKAFCGEKNGALCDSQNVQLVLDRAYEIKSKVLFVPDANLGRFAAYSVGLCESDVVEWDPQKRSPASNKLVKLDGSAPSAAETEQTKRDDFNELNNLRLRKLILWSKSCPAYAHVSAEQVAALKNSRSNLKVAVPESCSEEARRIADVVGGVSDVINAVAKSDADVLWVVGKERSNVDELQKQFPDRIFLLFDEEKLVECQARKFNHDRFNKMLDAIESGSSGYRVQTSAALIEPIYRALENMFQMIE